VEEEAEPVNLFVSGEQYHTFRIPALVSNGKVVLAFCEGRKNSNADYGVIDVVLKVSKDEGKSWSKLMRVIGDGKNTFGNPCPVFYGKELLLFYCVNNRQVFLIKSRDYGKSWSKPIKILEEKNWMGTGPGHALKVEKRVLVPCYVRPNRFFNKSYSFVVSSRDLKKWVIEKQLQIVSHECQIMRVGRGIYLNARCADHHFTFKRRRVSAFSDDFGRTWVEQGYTNLRDPICHASLLNFKNHFLFCNPNSFFRRNLTIHKSKDCREWVEWRVVNKGWSGYSDLASVSDNLLVLFENGERDYRERISFEVFGNTNL
jgi:sialidase-1